MGQAKHWDVQTGDCRMTFKYEETNVTYILPLMNINMVIVLYADGTLGLFDIPSGKLIKTIKKHQDCVTMV